MTRQIEFVSETEGISAKAVLWEEHAPRTCQLVWQLLPVSTYFQHAIYSGPELAMILPNYHPIEPENATTTCLPWEIGFASLQAKGFVDVDDDFSELMFFYDRNTGPKMLDGLVKVNLFAQFVSGMDALRELAFRIRLEGRKPVTIQRVE